jgi:3-methyladenine DNA glycosylase AlkC
MANTQTLDPELQAAIGDLIASLVSEDQESQKQALVSLRTVFVPAFRKGWGVVNTAGTVLGSELLKLPTATALGCLQTLADDPNLEMRSLAARSTGYVGQTNPEDIVPIVYHLAADESWEVREVIANALDDLISPNHPDWLYALMERWSQDHDANVRRVPTNALMRFGRKHPRDVLALMESLRYDDSDYVRRNIAFCFQQSIGKIKHPMLGPAIPGGPEMLLKTLDQWAEDPDWRPRWIVATTLGNVWAKDFIQSALDILERLAEDAHPQVQTAVANALKTLAKSRSAEVHIALDTWVLSGHPQKHALAQRVAAKLL